MNETLAQEASGSTITTWVDRRSAGFPCRRDGTRTEEAVDAVGPVDAQNAPTGPWNTADGVPQAPTATTVVLIEEKSRTQTR